MIEGDTPEDTPDMELVHTSIGDAFAAALRLGETVERIDGPAVIKDVVATKTGYIVKLQRLYPPPIGRLPIIYMGALAFFVAFLAVRCLR